GQIDRFGVLDHVLHVFFSNLTVRRNHRVHSAIVKAAQVSASHAEIDAANFNVGHLLGFDDGVANVLADGGRVSNLALAHAARAGLSYADDVERASGVDFSDDGANF